MVKKREQVRQGQEGWTLRQNNATQPLEHRSKLTCVGCYRSIIESFLFWKRTFLGEKFVRWETLFLVVGIEIKEQKRKMAIFSGQYRTFIQKNIANYNPHRWSWFYNVRCKNWVRRDWKFLIWKPEDIFVIELHDLRSSRTRGEDLRDVRFLKNPVWHVGCHVGQYEVSLKYVKKCVRLRELAWLMFYAVVCSRYIVKNRTVLYVYIISRKIRSAKRMTNSKRDETWYNKIK